MPTPLVVDANIWMNLHKSGILSKVVGAGYGLIMPDVVLEEANHPNHQDGLYRELESLVSDEIITLKELNGDEVDLAVTLQDRYQKLTTNDSFALALAISQRIVLVTGDKHLRRAAIDENADVHGVLWLLKRMVDECILEPLQACNALEQMLAHGARLPKTECQSFIARWRRTSG